ncbi:hypothetical protein BD311DRAFT_539250 [Dichomitus squalens]|uniref:Uncharacterized protein n=1 Tax=Dichomitus squalens TaxID=114155 RepID=A0A4Q9MBQ2_9APHY|nr:hypothetical protein BD311DRAFT_539250 [Dichomitus squalens]
MSWTEPRCRAINLRHRLNESLSNQISLEDAPARTLPLCRSRLSLLPPQRESCRLASIPVFLCNSLLFEEAILATTRRLVGRMHQYPPPSPSIPPILYYIISFTSFNCST